MPRRRQVRFGRQDCFADNGTDFCQQRLWCLYQRLTLQFMEERCETPLARELGV